MLTAFVLSGNSHNRRAGMNFCQRLKHHVIGPPVCDRSPDDGKPEARGNQAQSGVDLDCLMADLYHRTRFLQR